MRGRSFLGMAGENTDFDCKNMVFFAIDSNLRLYVTIHGFKVCILSI